MKRGLLTGVLGCTLALTTAVASGADTEKAKRLGGDLTPLGAERAGSEDGVIPAWQGGQVTAPACYRAGERYCNPYAGERPYATISADNLDDWREKLSEGQIEMILRHPETYRIELYKTRRTFANPEAVYSAARENAVSAVLAPSGREVRDAKIAVPFPIPSEALEMVWNHRLRYRGPGIQRWLQQAIVTASGEANVTEFLENIHFPYGRGMELDDFMALYWVRVAVAPEDVEGAVSLVHDSINHEEEPSLAWTRGTDEQYMVRDRSHGYDGVTLLSGSLRLDDQLDTYFGNPDRYTWKLINKQTMAVPYNSNALHNRESLGKVIRPAHPNSSALRYELHRVWIVDGMTKPSAVHKAKRRRLYIDEDSWQILMVDLYDAQNRLWRSQETHTLMAQDHPVLVPIAEVIHDFETGRYLFEVIADDKPEMRFEEFTRRDFGRGRAQSAGYRALLAIEQEQEATP